MEIFPPISFSLFGCNTKIFLLFIGYLFFFVSERNEISICQDNDFVYLFLNSEDSIFSFRIFGYFVIRWFLDRCGQVVPVQRWSGGSWIDVVRWFLYRGGQGVPG